MLVTWLAACGSSTSAPAPDASGPDGAVDAPVHFDARTTCDDGGTSCDVFLSCGCAPTDKCTPATNGLACMPAGSGAAGDSCGSDATCARGTTCVAFAGATTCHPFCDDAHACPASTACYIEAADRNGVQVGMLCGPSCTLLTQDCPGALGCYPADQAVDPDHGICLSPGVGTQGQSCSQMTNCAPGYGCIDPAGSATPICAKICALGGGAPSCDPGSGATCRKLLGSSANSQTGVCLP